MWISISATSGQGCSQTWNFQHYAFVPTKTTVWTSWAAPPPQSFSSVPCGEVLCDDSSQERQIGNRPKNHIDLLPSISAQFTFTLAFLVIIPNMGVRRKTKQHRTWIANCTQEWNKLLKLARCFFFFSFPLHIYPEICELTRKGFPKILPVRVKHPILSQLTHYIVHSARIWKEVTLSGQNSQSLCWQVASSSSVKTKSETEDCSSCQLADCNFSV